MKKLNLKKMNILLIAVILVTVSGLAISKGKADNQRAKQWYLSNTVSVYDPVADETYTSINRAVMGKLAESSDGYDKHDIRPYASMANSKAAVFFIQENWGDMSGEYHSNYYNTRRRNADWAFTVVSTVPYGEVTLNWSGLNELTSQVADGSTTYKEKLTLDSRTLERLHLVDLQTGEIVDALAADGAINSYSFVMGFDQKQRNFRWVLGPVNATHFKNTTKTSKYLKSERQQLASKQKAKKRNARVSADKFGLPPQ